MPVGLMAVVVLALFVIVLCLASLVLLLLMAESRALFLFYFLRQGKGRPAWLFWAVFSFLPSTPWFTSLLSSFFTSPLAVLASRPAFLYRHLGILVYPVPTILSLPGVPGGCAEEMPQDWVTWWHAQSSASIPSSWTHSPDGPGKNQR